jgi:hypothetical protein
MASKIFQFVCLLFFTSFLHGQISQNVRGTVYDLETRNVLVGAKLTLTDDTLIVARAISDYDGNFEMKNVPIGKYTLTTTYMFYLDQRETVSVNSGKETVINILLQEDITTVEEIQVVGRKEGELNNDMATVSAQQFSVEETERYAGSRADPARMASNFAGVQGADDSRNDIIIRGNSPLGLLYRVEDIDIPNPNHFAVSGSAGGPVAIINNKILANSDFFMSAFPADYGNSIAGVFDLKFRKGNTNKHELTGQFGFLGTEVMAEGPINREKKSSYLAMGRYSTLSMIQAIGLSIGTDAVPIYGDGAYKLNFPLNNGGNLSFWGMGGASTISIVISEQTQFTEEAFGEGDRDQYFNTAMGVAGVSYKKPLNKKTYFKTSLATSLDLQRSNHDFLIRSVDTVTVDGQDEIRIQTDSIYALMGYQFQTNRITAYTSLNHKINRQHIIRFGLSGDAYFMNNLDSSLVLGHQEFITRHDFAGSAFMIQPFVQYKWRVNQNMDLTAGLHSQYFTLSDSYSIAEPRIGWKYNMNNKNSFSAGVGLHSQMQPLYQYTYQQLDDDGNFQRFNQNMDFTRSFHSAFGYQRKFSKSLSLKTEVYYQHLYNIPVDQHPSAFSLINQGAGFQRFFPDELVNEGIGENYGIELTLQKFFDESFYFLVTASFFESKYQGSDGVWRNTDFNGRYAANFLAGKEFTIKGKNVLGLGLKVTGAGGRWYGFVDEQASLETNELVFLDSAFNTRQFRDYFRLDFKILYKINTDKMTHEIGLDLVNVLNTQNILALSYAPSLIDPSAEPVAERMQLGFLPIFYYRADIRLKNKKKDESTIDTP